MKVVVYICCDPKQRELGEHSVRLAWADDSSQPDQISMGKERNWSIAQSASYLCSDQEPISQVEVAYVYRDDMPSPAKWQFQTYQEDYPLQALEVRVADIGSNFLGWAVRPQGGVPEIDEYLVNYGIKPNGTRMARTEPWFKTAVDSFHNSEAIRPFASVHIVHHQIKDLAKVPSVAVV